MLALLLLLLLDMSMLQKVNNLVFAVRHNVLVNGTLKNTLELDSWFVTGLVILASAVLYT